MHAILFTFVTATVQGRNRSPTSLLVPPEAAPEDAAVGVQKSAFTVPQVQGPPSNISKSK